MVFLGDVDGHGQEHQPFFMKSEFQVGQCALRTFQMLEKLTHENLAKLILVIVKSIARFQWKQALPKSCRGIIEKA